MINETAAGIGTLGKIGSVFGNISHGIGSVILFLEGLGLTSTQAYVVIGLLALIALLFVFKFLAIITKVLIVVLILWVVVSIVGLI